MIRPARRPFRSLLIAALAGGLGFAAAAPAADRPHPLAAAFLSDAAVKAAVLRDGAALIESGAAEPPADLQAQLRRETCDLRVPAVAPMSGDPAARLGAATLIVSELYTCASCDDLHANHAAGFVVSPDGLAVTNYHVIRSDRDAGDGPAGFVATTRAGLTVPIAEVLAADRAADVALVRLKVPDGVTLAAVPLAASSTVGEEAHCVSHPSGRFYSYSRGYVTRRHRVRTRRGPTDRVTVSAEFAKGSSGAAVTNAAGAALGIVTTTDSVYYSERGGEQRDLQMVFRDCVPVESLRALFAPPDGVAATR